MDYTSYQSLIRPSWAPPSWLFGPVWAFLYILIFISFGFVFYKFLKKKISFKTALPFFLNLLFNFAFTPIQFGLKNLSLASIDILLVFFTLLWSIFIIFPKFRWVGIINIPYLLWVSFATVLQLTVFFLNF
jgi:tryptophan-rich sensory protein